VTTRGVAGLAVADGAEKMPSSAVEGVKWWGCGRLLFLTAHTFFLLLSCRHLLLLTRRPAGMVEGGQDQQDEACHRSDFPVHLAHSTVPSSHLSLPM
jgi:hypothetical protein